MNDVLVTLRTAVDAAAAAADAFAVAALAAKDALRVRDMFSRDSAGRPAEIATLRNAGTNLTNFADWAANPLLLLPDMVISSMECGGVARRSRGERK